jgi:hypothetical protein
VRADPQRLYERRGHPARRRHPHGAPLTREDHIRPRPCRELGAEVDAIAYLTGRYFGLRHYGLLFGALIGCTALSTGSGPLLAGYIYGRTGAYDLPLMAGIPMALTATVLILLLGRVPPWRSETPPPPA